jgi:putative flippase GtrA
MPLQTFRYAFCGGSNVAFDIFLYFIIYNFILRKEDVDFGLVVVSPHIAALLFAASITFFTGFLLQKYITFSESYLRGHVQLFRYGLSFAVSLLINYVFLKLFVDHCHIYPTPSKILATGIAVVFSYFAQKHYSFKAEKKIS